MKLINATDAVKNLEEQMTDLNEVIKTYKMLIINLNKVTGEPIARQKLYNAGFTDEKIDEFISIMLEDD